MAYNNGGFSLPRTINPVQGTMFMKLGKTYGMGTEPRKNAMPVEYRSDGTGRDSYIVCNSGGLQTQYFNTQGESFFKNSLRQNDRQNFFSGSRRGQQTNKYLTDQFEVNITKYRNWITPKEQMKI